MKLTDEDIDKILKIVEESTFDSLYLEYGDLKLTVGKGGNLSGQPVPGKSDPSTGASDSSPPRVTGQVKQRVVEHSHLQPAGSIPKVSATQTAEEENLISIKSPMVGTFYCSPEPGVEPFVRVGSKVDEDTVVGLIEVMKVFTSVRARAKGEIARCLVEDAQFVEYGQPLFFVRPDEGKDG
jgi:acetyl-CoA carboxylase biotin carboxyl carrier protein